jgi:hypothetical protein
VKKSALLKTRKKFERFLAFVDRLVSERMVWEAGCVPRRIAAVIVFLLGVWMIPFEFVPLAGAAPAFCVALFGVVITARDGVVMLLALAAFMGVAALGMALLF